MNCSCCQLLLSAYWAHVPLNRLIDSLVYRSVELTARLALSLVSLCFRKVLRAFASPLFARADSEENVHVGQPTGR